MHILRFISLLLAIGGLPALATAAPTDPIGSAIAIKNDVRAEFDNDRRDLSTGDMVHQDEIIAVGPASIGELELDDDTKLALGPGARLKLDKFVYNGEKSNGDIVVNLVQGAFRFITGVATKKSYRIRTPSASITVRGTIFDVFVADDGMMWLLLLDGGVTTCNDRGNCSNLNKPGLIIHVTPDGEVSKPTRWAALPGRDIFGFNSAFPFVVNAPSIDPVRLLTREAIIRGDQPGKKSTPKRKAKKKYKKKTKTAKRKPAKIKKKQVKKVYKKKKKKKTKKASNNGNKALNAAIAIGAGIAIGKMLSKKKKRHPKPCRGHKCY